MSACEQPLVYTTDPTDAPRRDFTAEIAAADSPEDQRKLLAEKQAALQLLHPPRPRQVPKPKQAEPEQIKDPGLRRNYERSEAEEADREPVKKPSSTGSYAHGISMALTVEKVCMRPDISWRGKAVAMALSSHWPNVRPSNQRLRLLTGHGKKTVERGLAELKAKGLLTWKRGKPRRANEYTCKWLSHRASQTLP